MCLRLRRHTLPRDRTLVMGILNVTPDSFSDGGRFLDVEAAFEQALRLVEEGADLLDVGGESTRPGADEVPAEEERDRVLPVIERLRERWGAEGGVPISVDTAKPGVAAAALEAGAEIVNDVTGLHGEMLAVTAEHDAAGIAMHMQGTPRTMQHEPRYHDVVAEVRDFLAERAEAARAVGVEVALDPGIGFGKTLEHNLELLRNLDRIAALGRPVLVGASRKSFLGKLGDDAVRDLEPGPRSRLEGTIAAHTAAILGGARIVRAHDVREARRSAAVADAVARARRRPSEGRLVLDELRCMAHVGVPEAERGVSQEVVVSVEAELDPGPAAQTDRFDLTVDYVAVAESVRETIEARPRALIETLAGEIAEGLLGRFSALSRVRVRVAKPLVARVVDAGGVAVEATLAR